jgi:hypothetical protein
MADFEKLGVFYLGRPFELENKRPGEGLLLYDSKDLVTHAVCVGMTGSGKTGLCIDLLEEAAIDGIPAIIIDPKGDLANLLLTFPELRPEDFRPWVNAEDAQKKGLTTDDFAAQQSQLWRDGLASWGQDRSRIRRLRDAADFRIYTPGSNAGIPVSILTSFAAPPTQVREDPELFNERISTTVTSLLGLLRIDADPIRSREHILLSNIVNQAWTAGTNLDLTSLIAQIQSPPLTRIGVMELESFFPSKDRFELAMALNSLLAAPGFNSWLEGESLDIQNILYTAAGKPRMAIFSIAHLSDAERMFFVSLLLNQMLGWVRAQSGTTSLRAILYIDEIFGYFPPVANPPSKQPLMTLLKQARAFGLGVVLVTQNPVDLDYKGLSNAGTWFIGRLQTERDKARVIEGLEGISTSAGSSFDRQKVERTLAGLGNRVFLLNNVHDDEDVIFESRWAMSYLRGPLTRDQIKSLMDPLKSGTANIVGEAKPPQPHVSSATKSRSSADASAPLLPPEISQFFLPIRGDGGGATVFYEPKMFATADLRLSNKQIDTNQSLTLLAPITDGPAVIVWDQGAAIEFPVSDLESVPVENAQFSTLPTVAGKAKSYETWKKDFASWIYRTQKLDLFRSAALGMTAEPGESERDFRVRLQQAAREKRDDEVAKLREKYAPKIAALEERRRRAEQAVARESEQASSSKMQTAISFGATLLSSFLGRKSVSLSTLGRATTAARGVGRSMKEASDVNRAEDSLQVIDQKLSELNEEFRNETEKMSQAFDPQTEQLETISVKPTKTNISVKLCALVWAPYWQNSAGQKIPAWE